MFMFLHDGRKWKTSTPARSERANSLSVYKDLSRNECLESECAQHDVLGHHHAGCDTRKANRSGDMRKNIRALALSQFADRAFMTADETATIVIDFEEMQYKSLVKVKETTLAC